MTVLIQRGVLSCPLYKWLTSPAGEFCHLFTHLNFRVVSKVCEAMESLAFHRVIALLRTDPDHEQKLLLPRLLACRFSLI